MLANVLQANDNMYDNFIQTSTSAAQSQNQHDIGDENEKDKPKPSRKDRVKVILNRTLEREYLSVLVKIKRKV